MCLFYQWIVFSCNLSHNRSTDDPKLQQSRCSLGLVLVKRLIPSHISLRLRSRSCLCPEFTSFITLVIPFWQSWILDWIYEIHKQSNLFTAGESYQTDRLASMLGYATNNLTCLSTRTNINTSTRYSSKHIHLFMLLAFAMCHHIVFCKFLHEHHFINYELNIKVSLWK